MKPVQWMAWGMLNPGLHIGHGLGHVESWLAHWAGLKDVRDVEIVRKIMPRMNTKLETTEAQYLPQYASARKAPMSGVM
jgi:hypothetical protein